jgi:putative heme-binding domain-containing protein
MNSTQTEIQVSTESMSRWAKLAAMTAGSSVEAIDRRLFAVRVLAHMQPEFGGKVLLELLQPQQPAEIQSAAVEALVGLGDRELAGELFASWKQYTSATRRQLLAVAPRSSVALVALIEALERGSILTDEIAPSTQVALRQIKNSELARRVKKFIEIVSTDSREQVVKRFQPALQLSGDRGRGAATFVKLCLPCHAIAGTGNRVGPDLAGIATRPREAVLVDILDPSRQVTPDFVSYTLTTKQGGTETGLLAAESANSITLRRVGLADETFLRTQITGLRADSKSLMPDGLEQGLTLQDMADLLDFLQNPDKNFSPETK